MFAISSSLSEKSLAFLSILPNDLLINVSISYKKLFSQIPADCVAKIVNRKMYQLSEMTLVVVSHGDILFDCYIETHMNETNPKFNNIISSFLFD